MGVGNGSCKVDDAHKRVYRQFKEKEVALLNHKPTKVLQLSISNPVVSCKPDTESLRQKLADG